MSGFCKTGIYPLNPGRISDYELAPSKVFVTSERDLVDSSSSEQLTGSSVHDILKLPEAKSSVKQTSSLTSTAQCLTDSPFLNKMKKKKAMREIVKAMRKGRRQARQEPVKFLRGSPMVERLI